MSVNNSPLPMAERPGFKDQMARSVRYLRVSVTDRCNFRCVYCHPTTNWVPTERNNILSLEEISRFVSWMVEGGVRKVRLTGGEPLIRKGIVELVRALKRIPGLEELVMTTNGFLLERFAEPLREAGLDRLNVSLDTLDKQGFEALVKSGTLKGVLNGLDVAEKVGFKDTRVNAVLVRDVPASQRLELAEYCWSRGFTPRYIEMMPIGGLDYQSGRSLLTTSELVADVNDRHPLVLEESVGGLSGPAKYWVVQDGAFKGKRLGTISPMSDNHFCGTCNRARLTVSGGFRGCLGSDNEVQLLQDIRNGSKAGCLASVHRALSMKLPSHLMSEPGFVPLSAMTGIGG
jgi:GTP 3',8-cyclase